jgi:IS30 family transposase
MPREPELNSFEIGQILAFRDVGLGLTEIARKICRDKSTISRFLKDPENYGSNKHSGRPRTLDPLAERHLLNAAKTVKYSANQLRLNQHIPLSTRRIQSISHTSPELKYEKSKSSPKLTNAHINN